MLAANGDVYFGFEQFGDEAGEGVELCIGVEATVMGAVTGNDRVTWGRSYQNTFGK